MSTTTTTATLDARVRGYAEAVRLHLADLGPDAVDGLTDGLEADLADSLADRSATFAEADDAGAVPDLATVFGPADQYAAELRSAAGLPPASTAPSAKAGLRQSLRGARARWLRLWEPLTTSPAWARFRALLTDLRPFGWVARGWLVAAFVDGWMRQGPWMLVPRHGVALFWFAIAVLVSVQWGRGRWQPFKWVKALATLATVVALLAVVPMSDNTIHSARWGWDQRGASWVQEDGVFVDGHPVTNIFPFDADGRPLENVQLFDEAGRPIQTRPADWGVDQVQINDWAWGWLTGATSDDGRVRRNVFPLQVFREGLVGWDSAGFPVPLAGAEPETAPWPFELSPFRIPVSQEEEVVADDEALAAEEPAEGEVPAADEPAAAEGEEADEETEPAEPAEDVPAEEPGEQPEG